MRIASEGYRPQVAARPSTRLGVLALAGHLGYELVAGVAMPLSPRLGVRTASVVLGAPLAAVLGHYSSWPRVWHAGVPWLTECEGLDGPVIVPYNVLLQISGAAAVAGLVENRSQWGWGLAAALLLAPALRWATPREYARLREQASRRPAWWNRRLARKTATHPFS